MRILVCDEPFPSMIDTIRNLQPDDDIQVCRPMEVAREAPWAGPHHPKDHPILPGPETDLAFRLGA
jgi:hypothetical protein